MKAGKSENVSGDRFLPEAEDVKKRFHLFNLRRRQQHDQMYHSINREDRGFW
jgi:hypothetical protein